MKTADHSGDAENARLEAMQTLALRLIFGEEFSSTDTAVRVVADYRVPSLEDRPFVEFIEWINTNPTFIRVWREKPETEHRVYLRFLQGLGACRGGYAASSYHLQRVNEIDEQVHSILKDVDFKSMFPRGMVSTLGTMRQLDFEYQAFVMAYRRALDGFAWGLSTYFSSSQSSYRKFVRDLPKYHPSSVANALFIVCERHKDNFAFVMDDQRGKAIRDRMAHKEAVQAGTINVGAFGYRIVGGGEDLGLQNFDEPAPRLVDVLKSRLGHLNALIAEILQSFRSAVELHETDQSGPSKA